MANSNSAKTAGYRSKVYGILALAFSFPTQGPKALHEEILGASEYLGALEGARFPQETTEDSQLLERLRAEYLRLFVGPGHVPCPPYESVYRTDRPVWQRGLVMGPSTADVRRRYAEAALTISKNYRDLPDHVSVEMEFMHFLCAEESKLTELGNIDESAKMRKMQRDFLEDHIMPWTGNFAERILNSTDSSFYKAAANLLRAVVKSDFEYLSRGDA